VGRSTLPTAAWPAPLAGGSTADGMISGAGVCDALPWRCLPWSTRRRATSVPERAGNEGQQRAVTHLFRTARERGMDVPDGGKFRRHPGRRPAKTVRLRWDSAPGRVSRVSRPSLILGLTRTLTTAIARARKGDRVTLQGHDLTAEALVPLPFARPPGFCTVASPPIAVLLYWL
jgi:hypothetical protein